MPDELEDIQPDEESGGETEAQPPEDDMIMISDGADAKAKDEAAAVTEVEGGSVEEAPAEEEAPKDKKKRRSTRLKSEAKKAPKQDALEKSILKGELKYKDFETICSECYEDFSLNPNIKVEKFNCPECDHAAKGPEEDFLRKYYGAKEKEGFSLKVAIIAIAAMVLFAILLPITSANSTGESSGMQYMFYFLIFAGFIVALIFGIMYEIKRYETYF